jgi:hypothetical protein
MSTDAGVSWNMIRKDAHKYEFGDQGSILVVINDEDKTDTIRYSLDLGKTWCVLSILVPLESPSTSTCALQAKIRHRGELARTSANDTPGLDLAKVRATGPGRTTRPN